jgi:hypothetical protein
MITIEPTQIQKFAAVFAEAVLTWLDSKEPQWLTWDGYSHRFDFSSIELDEPIMPVMLIIDDNWEKLSGEISEVTDPESSHFDTDALRAAIEEQLIDEGAGERILKMHLKRLEKLAEDSELEDDSDRTEPSNSEDL